MDNSCPGGSLAGNALLLQSPSLAYLLLFVYVDCCFPLELFIRTHDSVGCQFSAQLNTLTGNFSPPKQLSSWSRRNIHFILSRQLFTIRGVKGNNWTCVSNAIVMDIRSQRNNRDVCPFREYIYSPIIILPLNCANRGPFKRLSINAVTTHRITNQLTGRQPAAVCTTNSFSEPYKLIGHALVYPASQTEEGKKAMAVCGGDYWLRHIG